MPYNRTRIARTLNTHCSLRDLREILRAFTGLREILRAFTGFTGKMQSAVQCVTISSRGNAMRCNRKQCLRVLRVFFFLRKASKDFLKNRESLEEPQLRVLRVFSSQSTCNAIQSDAHCTDIEYALQFTGFTGNLTGFYRIYGKSYGLLRVLREKCNRPCNALQSVVVEMQ
jgi:hypothetical protein